MLQFYAHEFVEITKALTLFRLGLRQMHGTKPVLPKDESTAVSIEEIVERCRRVGMTLAAKQAERLLEIIRDEGRTDATAEALDQAIVETQNRIADELELVHFLSLTNEESQFYEPEFPLFGNDVSNKFPTASYEIEEAGKCIALGRSTAAVFHLMRVMEIGIGAIRRSLGIPDPIRPAERNWGVILKKIKDAIDQKSPWQANDKLLFDGAYASLDAVRVAWRNSTMHVENKYTTDEAKHLFAVVKGFMQKIASRMNELGKPLA